MSDIKKYSIINRNSLLAIVPRIVAIKIVAELLTEKIYCKFAILYLLDYNLHIIFSKTNISMHI